MEDVAIDLYERQGLSATTAAQIAMAAGTTPRTFFRHFRDKVDAAFGDESRLHELAAEAVRSAPPNATPWSAVHGGLRAIGAEFDERRAPILRRSRVVAAEPALRERELSRSTDWSAVLVTALRARNVPDSTAVLCAGTGLNLFRIALEGWSVEPSQPFTSLLDENFRALRHEVTLTSRP
jgi:AcrR family transcriptional regulator